MEDIPNKVRDILGILVQVNLREETGKEYLEIAVESYPYPVSYKGEYHLRSGSTKQELKGSTLDKFLLRKQGRHWDGVPVPYVTMAELDASSFKYFRRAAAKSGRMNEEVLQDSNQTIIENLQLCEGGYLRRAAALLFHENPERFVPGAFFRTGDIESWGRGIDKVRDACRESDVEFPSFEFEKTGLMVEFKRRIPVEESRGEAFVVPGRAGKKTAGETTQKMLEILADDPCVSRIQIAELLGDISEDGVKYQLAKLKKRGLIRRMGPDKGGHWEVLK
jgi:predicted HTH transcriptional regulator